MTNQPQEEGAEALGRWLDECLGSSPSGSTSGAPPPELEPDIVQTIYALRPELAPAPRLTADDILASVMAGPLARQNTAATGVERQEGAEVVPFPSRPLSVPEPHAAPARPPSRHRWMRLFGGPGGLGMALVAAATILLVATPILSPKLSPRSADQPSPAVLAPTSLERNALEEQAAMPARDEALQAEVTGSPAARARAPSFEQGVAAAPAEQTAIEMDRRAIFRENSLIPELTEPSPEEPLGSAEAVDAVTSTVTPTTSTDQAMPDADKAGLDLDQLRAKANKTRNTAWRRGIAQDVLDEIDQAMTEANALRKAGNPKAAGDKLIPLIRAPARAGQAVAVAAAEHYFAANDPDQAVGAVEMGLNLATSPSPERSQLYLLLGDGLRALGNAEGAADAYRNAR